MTFINYAYHTHINIIAIKILKLNKDFMKTVAFPTFTRNLFSN